MRERHSMTSIDPEKASLEFSDIKAQTEAIVELIRESLRAVKTASVAEKTASQLLASLADDVDYLRERYDAMEFDLGCCRTASARRWGSLKRLVEMVYDMNRRTLTPRELADFVMAAYDEDGEAKR
jgi:hypothetical protein